jgi:hypothetical protein
MENEEKNPYLFYFIIALVVLGFIASLPFPLNAQEHKLRDASDAGDFPLHQRQPSPLLSASITAVTTHGHFLGSIKPQAQPTPFDIREPDHVHFP